MNAQPTHAKVTRVDYSLDDEALSLTLDTGSKFVFTGEKTAPFFTLLRYTLTHLKGTYSSIALHTAQEFYNEYMENL